MKKLVALMLAGACLPVHAAPPAACDKAVRFSAAWFPDPEVDNARTVAELAAMSAGGGRGGTELGHVVVETKLSVSPQAGCQGLVVRLDYVKPVLRVAREFPPGGCAHAHVMSHEQTHVRIHRDIARQFRELDYPWGTAGGTAAVLAYARQELDRLMQAQALFDSPAEYAKNDSACGGEIRRLLPPGAGSSAARRPA